jgi:hypothetical protein
VAYRHPIRGRIALDLVRLLRLAGIRVSFLDAHNPCSWRNTNPPRYANPHCQTFQSPIDFIPVFALFFNNRVIQRVTIIAFILEIVTMAVGLGLALPTFVDDSNCRHTHISPIIVLYGWVIFCPCSQSIFWSPFCRYTSVAPHSFSKHYCLH